MTVFCVHLVIDQIQSGASGFVRQGSRHGPFITYKITACWVTLLQPARQAAVLGQHSSLRSHWARLPSTVNQAEIKHSMHETGRSEEDQVSLLSSRTLFNTLESWYKQSPYLPHRVGTGNCVSRRRGIAGCRKGSISNDSKRTRSSLQFLLYDPKKIPDICRGVWPWIPTSGLLNYVCFSETTCTGNSPLSTWIWTTGFLDYACPL